MNDDQIETQRVAGDVTLVLKNGSPEEKESLLKAIEQIAGVDERIRLENWMKKGCPDA